jgi:hypothetical protein
MRKRARQPEGVRGGGPIYALAPTESVSVPIHAVLWLDDEHAT